MRDQPAHELPPDLPPERPRAEPEILPPDGEEPIGRGMPPRMFVFVDRDGRTRFASFRPPGPLALFLALFILGGIAASILVLLLGFVLIWIPVAVVVVAALAFSSQIRAAWRRLTGRS
jgi:hypothetical protein